MEEARKYRASWEMWEVRAFLEKHELGADFEEMEEIARFLQHKEATLEFGKVSNLPVLSIHIVGSKVK